MSAAGTKQTDRPLWVSQSLRRPGSRSGLGPAPGLDWDVDPDVLINVEQLLMLHSGHVGFLSE